MRMALALVGVTREITVPVRVTRQQGVRAFVADFTLDRYDYEIHGGSVMSRLIERTVRVHLVAVERSRMIRPLR